MGLHDGHRQRKRERFLKQGADGLADHEVLELLLDLNATDEQFESPTLFCSGRQGTLLLPRRAGHGPQAPV